MAYLLKYKYSNKYNLFFVFANTGQERAETLDFANKCDIHFIWIEAKVFPKKGKGTKHNIVNFQTADRSGVIFERVIKKYGIPNQNAPHCVRELKQRPIASYGKSIGAFADAIGIRVDEPHRLKQRTKTVYPLADWHPTTKKQIDIFWKKQPFNLEIEDYRGNCSWCWKKSFKKLYRLVEETPDIFHSHWKWNVNTIYRDLREKAGFFSVVVFQLLIYLKLPNALTSVRTWPGKQMKAKDVKCKKCGGLPILHGQDPHDTEGPYYIMCNECWEDTGVFAYPREAWAQWKYENQNNGNIKVESVR